MTYRFTCLLETDCSTLMRHISPFRARNYKHYNAIFVVFYPQRGSAVAKNQEFIVETSFCTSPIQVPHWNAENEDTHASHLHTLPPMDNLGQKKFTPIVCPHSILLFQSTAQITPSKPPSKPPSQWLIQCLITFLMNLVCKSSQQWTHTPQLSIRNGTL